MANQIESPVAAAEPPTPVRLASFGVKSGDALPLVAALSGLAAGFSGQQPTGNVIADFLFSFGFGWGLVWISQFARAEAVVVSSVLAIFLSGMQTPAVLMAAAAAAAALFITAWKDFDKDSAIISLGVSAVFTGQAALNLPNIGFTGSASLLAAICVAPIVISGCLQLPPTPRRGVVRAALLCACCAVLATALAVIAALSVRGQVESGIEQAEGGVSALRAADRPQALSLLGAAEDNFVTAHNRLSGPLTWPARLVPLTAQHSRAIETAAAQGAALARTAGRTATEADVEQIRGRNGAIDLEIVHAVNDELTLANEALQHAQQSLTNVTVPWLVPQLSSRLTLVQDELAEAALDIDLASQATTVLPGILGADGQRRYLVLFVQPAESREFGGFVGAYGILEATDGKMTLAESGSIVPDIGVGIAQFTDVSQFPEPYVRIGPQINAQNLTTTADLATIAAAARDFVPQWREDSNFAIDGVVTIDPYALAGLLELAGPLSVAGREEPLDSTTIVDFLLRGQYLEFDNGQRDERQDILRVLAGQAFERLFELEIPGPERLGSIFGPLARADRLSFATFDDAENAFLDRVFLSANLPQVGSAVDMVGIYGQTGTASKLDGYATRSSSYEVVVDPATGDVRGELTITERNDAPPDAGTYVLGKLNGVSPTDAPMAAGSNLLAFGIYTRADVESISADTAFRLEDPLPAYSYTRHPVFVEVPLGGQSTISLSHTWQVAPERYDVFIPAQATANPSEFTLTVRATPGWRVRALGADTDGSWTDTFTLDEARGLTFFFEETG